MATVINRVRGVAYIQVRYRDENNQRHRRGGFKTKAEAANWDRANALQVEAKRVAARIGQSPAQAYSHLTGAAPEQAEAIFEAADKMPALGRSSFAHWAEKFLKACKNGTRDFGRMEESTVRAYAYSLNMATAKLGTRAATGLTQDDFRVMRDELLETHAAGSVRMVLAVCRTFFAWMIEDEQVFKGLNPCAKIIRQGAKKGRDPLAVTDDMVPTTAEVQKIISELNRRVSEGRHVPGLSRAGTLRTDTMFRALFLVALYCGVRIGEARALQWKHVDFAARTLHIEQGMDRETNKIGTPKTKNGYRYIALPKAAAEALHAWRAATDKSPSSFVFTMPNGKPLNYERASTRWRRIQKDAGLKRTVKLHGARHYYASILLDSSDPDATDSAISKMLGHHSVEFTRRVYGHLMEKTKRRMVDAGMVDRVIAAAG